MNHTPLPGMTPIEQALERLVQAVEALEEAADVVESVSAEGQARELEAALAETAALRETHDLVVQRLDATIARLRTVTGTES